MSRSSRRTTKRTALAVDAPRPATAPRVRPRRTRRTALWLGLGGGGAAALVLGALQIAGRPDRAASGPVAVDLAADTVTVDRPEIDLGQVPLDKAVPVSVRLTNQSQRTVLLSQATAEALEGC